MDKRIIKFTKLFENSQVLKTFKVSAEVELLVEAESDGEAGYISDSILGGIEEQSDFKVNNIMEISKEEFKKLTENKMETNVRNLQGKFKNIAVPLNHNAVAIMTPKDIEILDPPNQREQLTKDGKYATSPVKFFSKLFEARQMAHIFHLQVNGQPGSGWEHTALNDFYEGILGLTDNLIETYQGQYEVVDGYEMIDLSETREYNSLNYLKDLVGYIKSVRYASLSEEDTHLQNIVDEIVALSYRTIYKLTYLK